MVEAWRLSKNLTSGPTRLLISCMYLRNCFMYIIYVIAQYLHIKTSNFIKCRICLVILSFSMLAII